MNIDKLLEDIRTAQFAINVTLERLEQRMIAHEDICPACKREKNDKAWDAYRTNTQQ